MKPIRWLMIGMVALLAWLAVACGGGGGEEEPPASETGSDNVPPAGMIRPNTFMTYDGQRYELVNMLFGDMVAADQFEVIGEASDADIDMKGDMRVFQREGDVTAVFTYSAPTADDGALWLAWRPVG